MKIGIAFLAGFVVALVVGAIVSVRQEKKFVEMIAQRERFINKFFDELSSLDRTSIRVEVYPELDSPATVRVIYLDRAQVDWLREAGNLAYNYQAEALEIWIREENSHNIPMVQIRWTSGQEQIVFLQPVYNH